MEEQGNLSLLFYGHVPIRIFTKQSEQLHTATALGIHFTYIENNGKQKKPVPKIIALF